MSHVDPGPLAAYNSLMDPHLAGYFSNLRRRKHLRQAGLVNRRGEVVAENTYRINMARKEHKKHVRDLLAQAIVHKTLDIERNRQVHIKKKLEEIAKIELVQNVKGEPSHWAQLYDELVPFKPRRRKRVSVPTQTDSSDNAARARQGDEEILPYLSPRSDRVSRSRPTSSKNRQGSAERRPKSAPAKSRRKNKGIYVDASGYPSEQIDDKHLYSLNSKALREYTTTMNMLEQGRGPSPYTLPLIQDDMVPMPPKTPRSARKPEKKSGSKGSRLHRQEPPMRHVSTLQTFCEITMHYFGSSLKLEAERFDPREEVCIEQQHCGGNTLTVFREQLLAGSDFKFTSMRHRGYPFSVTIYVNGVLDCRVSTCCEYKHPVGARLGGVSGHFGIVKIQKAGPCYKCEINKEMKAKDDKKKKKKKQKEEDDKYEDEFEPDLDDEGDEYSDDHESESEEEDIPEPPKKDDVDVKGLPDTMTEKQDVAAEKEKQATIPEPLVGDEEPLPWKDPYIEGSPNDMGDKSVRSESVNISDEEQVVNNGKNSIGGYEDDFSEDTEPSDSARSSSSAATEKSQNSARSHKSDSSVASRQSAKSEQSSKSASSRSSDSSSSSDSASSDSEMSEANAKSKNSTKSSESDGSKNNRKSSDNSDSDVKSMKQQESSDNNDSNDMKQPKKDSESEGEPESVNRPVTRMQRRVSSSSDSSRGSRGRKDSSSSDSDSSRSKKSSHSSSSDSEKESNLKKAAPRKLSPKTRPKSSVSARRLKKKDSINGNVSQSEEDKANGNQAKSPKPPTKGRSKTPSPKSSSPMSSKHSSSEEDKPNQQRSPPELIANEHIEPEPIANQSTSPESANQSSHGSSEEEGMGDNTMRDITREMESILDQSSDDSSKNNRKPSTKSPSSNSSRSSMKSPSPLDSPPASPKQLSMSPEPSSKSPVHSPRSNESSPRSLHDYIQKSPLQTPEKSPEMSPKSSVKSPEQSPRSPTSNESSPRSLQDYIKKTPQPPNDSPKSSTHSLKSPSGSAKSSPHSSKSSLKKLEDEEQQTTPQINQFNDLSTADDSQTENDNVVTESDLAGGNDPDNVLGTKREGTDTKLPPSKSFEGSLAPLVVNRSDVNLTNIRLSNDQITEFCTLLKSSPELTTLTLRNCDIGNAQLQDISQALIQRKDNSLTLVNLNCNNIDADGVPAILDILKYNSSLKVLFLHGSPIGDEGVVKLLDGVRSLCVSPEHLSEIQNAAKDVVHDALQGALQDKSLQNLQLASPLSSNQASDTSLVDRAEPFTCNLEKLELGGCNMTDSSAHALSQLLYSNTSLETLDLMGNPAITSDGWATIFRGLAENRRLETLVLDYNKISDETIRHLASAIKQNSSIKAIDLEGNNIGELGAECLLDALGKNRSIHDLTLSPGNDDIPAELHNKIRQNIQNRYM